ncbi:adhesion G protein-coupled receptor G3 [Dromiciops gliroides]|uniref:adhesion G protein-coupled receptor G3 n=1 Tax=Dromiciops gliroides TaxID=33562 RepID=UPI001CC3E424|nr:adhesion G protein-coupled receptor G3 [Dromiciops gliroides]
MRLRSVMGKSMRRYAPADLGAMLLPLLLLLQLDPMRAMDNQTEKERDFCSGEMDLSLYTAARCLLFCNRSASKCNPEVIERFWKKKEEELAKENSVMRVLDEPSVKAIIEDVPVNTSQDIFFSFSPSQELKVPTRLNGNETAAPNRVRLPRSLFENLRTRTNSVRVILMVINAGEGEIFKGSATGQKFSSSVLDNHIVGIRVGTEPIKDLHEPVEIIFSHKQQHQKLQCVFWEDNKGTTTDWKSTGCSTEQRTNQTICRCDHLTFFALLLKPVLDATTVKALIKISLAGCITSLLFLIFTIILYFVLRFTRQRFKSEDAPKIHVALSISLVLLNLTFIISLGNNSPEQGASCRAQGGIFHYFLLCCFTWMGIEAFNLYLLAIKIFNTYISHYFLKLCLVGWGLPILVVLITGSTSSYGRYDIKDGANHTTLELCWIENRTALHITVHGMFAVTFLFGGVVLGLVAWKIFHLHGSAAGKEQSQTWKGIVTVLGISCLVGGTWGLVLFTPIGFTAIYTFTLLNSLQGVFIFSWFAILYYPSLKGESSSSTAKTNQSNSASRE